MTPDHPGLLQLTADVVTAWTARTPSSRTELTEAIRLVYRAFADLVAGPAPQPAVPISQAVHRDYIICLECGRASRSLKPHLRVAHQMTPEEYRAKWRLPAGAPMIAAGYAAERAALARRHGFGRKPKEQVKGRRPRR